MADFDQTVPAQKGSNVLYHAFPPPAPASLGALLSKLRMLQYGSAAGLFLVWLSVAWGAGIYKFVWRTIVCSVVGGALMTGMSLVERGMEKEVERIRQDLGRQRGEAFSPPTPESVEWLNGLIKLMWGLVDPYVSGRTS
jgi:Ca2+-dependent lipid-binding protein